nr:Chain B, Gap junction gamma-1 protein [synthetic construct]
SGDGKTSVWI